MTRFHKDIRDLATPNKQARYPKGEKGPPTVKTRARFRLPYREKHVQNFTATNQVHLDVELRGPPRSRPNCCTLAARLK